MGNDRGQAVILLLAVVVMAALSVVGVGLFSTRIVDREARDTLDAVLQERRAVDFHAGRASQPQLKIMTASGV